MITAPRLVAAALVAGALAGRARAAEGGRPEDGAVAARKQARRANDLAALGKCRQAIPLFSKALEVLKDPALLFNRAECHRRLGNKDEALTDYVQFLVELPTAPNRAVVEQRIVALGGGRAAPAMPERSGIGPTPRPAAPSPPVALPPPDRESAGTATGPVPSPPPVSSPSALSLGDRAVVRPAAGSTAPPLRTEAAVAKSDRAPARSSGPSPWVWLGLGAAAVAAGTVGVYLLARPERAEIPGSDLGNFRF